MAAICNDSDMYAGFRLAGIDCCHATTEDELTIALTDLQVEDIEILVISEDLAKSAAFAEFTSANAHISVYSLK